MTIPRDLASGALILALSAFLWGVTTTFDSDPLGMEQGMPATHMPRLVLGVISGLAVLMMIQSVVRGGGAVGAPPPWRMPATAALLATAAALFTTVGVPIAFFAVCLCLPPLWGSRNWPAIAAFALGVPAAVHVVFKILLGLRLPMGPLAALGL